MSYSLITSERTPFGRVCRMFMLKHKLPCELKILNFVNDANAAVELSKETPINRVPILIDSGQKIFDSRVIINHLTKKHQLPALSIEEENLVSAIYSVMDTSLVLFLMRNDKFNIDGPESFLVRHRKRIPEGLEFISTWVEKLDPQNPKDWNYVSMSLYCCLEWCERRAKTLKASDYPVMADFLKNFAGSAGVKETALPD